MEQDTFPRLGSFNLITKGGINNIPYELFPYVFVDPSLLQCSCEVRSVITQINQRESNDSEIQ
jgi:hypothetical protein